MNRVPLPGRRRNETREVDFDGRRFSICVGFDTSGAPKEVFASGPKEGSAMQAIIADACVLISIALQHGIGRSALGHSLGRVPAFTDGHETERPASVIGLVVEALEPIGAFGGGTCG